MDKNKSLGSALIILAALMWGLLPLFSRLLYAQGYTPLQAASMRAAITAIAYLAYALVSGLFRRVALRDIPFYVLYGLVVMAGTNAFYLLAIERLSMAQASILLYTAPAYVTLFSRLFFKEPLTLKKLLMIAVTFAGCALVVQAYDLTAFSRDAIGIVFGVLSGLCYSMLTIFGRFGLRRYDSVTNTVLPSIFGVLPFLFIQPPWGVPLLQNSSLPLFAGLALIGSVVPYLLYVCGLSKGVDGSSASVMANIEPIAATLTGVCFFGDRLGALQVAGILLVLCGATMGALFSGKSENTAKPAA